MESKSKIRRFEDLIAWQKARALTKRIYLTTQQGSLAKDFGLSGQLQRASVSIMSNIAEGFERDTTADYRRFIIIAKASCAELRSQLYIASDIGYIGGAVFDELFNLTDELGRILEGLKTSLSKRL